MSQQSNHDPIAVQELNGTGAGPIRLPHQSEEVAVYYQVHFTLGFGRSRRRCVSPQFISRENAVSYARGILAGDERLGKEPGRLVSIREYHVPVPW